MANYKHKLINTEFGTLVLPRLEDISKWEMGQPDVRAESATQLFPIGSTLITDDGVYRYARCGADSVSIGKLLQQAAVGNAAQIRNVAVEADAAIGATSVTITTPTGDLTADYLKDGYLFVNDATGEGAVYKIKSHPAASAATSCVITLVDPLEVALVAETSKVGLRKNLYDAVIVNPITPTGIPIGVVNHSSFTATYYAWIKTKGIVAVLTNGTIIVGRMVAPGVTITGSVDTYPITLVEGTPNTYVPGDTPCVGVVMSVGATTEYSLVKIDLDPSW